MIHEDIWPVNRLPCKAQIEHMFRVGVRLCGPGFVRPEDESTFGLDMEFLRKRGEIGLSASLHTLRKNAESLWTRLDRRQQVFFVLTYLQQGVEYVGTILAALQDPGLDVESERGDAMAVYVRVTGKWASALEAARSA